MISTELCLETGLASLRKFVTVSGECAQAELSPIASIDFGPSAVGECVRKSLTLRNAGAYPLTYSIRLPYPLRVKPKHGCIAGGASADVVVSWVPSSAAALYHLVCHIDSNGGSRDVQVEGLGVFPRFVIDNSWLDFGKCALGVTYTRTFAIINRGQVSVAWSINLPSGCEFQVVPAAGRVPIDGTQTVQVLFQGTGAIGVGPRRLQFNIESNGAYRQVDVKATAAPFNFNPPTTMHVGDCGVGQLTRFHATLVNAGEVPLTVQVHSDAAGPQSPVRVALVPARVTIAAYHSVQVELHVSVRVAGAFECRMQWVCAESVTPAVVHGVGDVVQLSPLIQRMLALEQLPVAMKSPLTYRLEPTRVDAPLDDGDASTLTPVVTVAAVPPTDDACNAALATRPVLWDAESSLRPLLQPLPPILPDAFWHERLGRGREHCFFPLLPGEFGVTKK
jgi:hypothetical protein